MLAPHDSAVLIHCSSTLSLLLKASPVLLASEAPEFVADMEMERRPVAPEISRLIREPRPALVRFNGGVESAAGAPKTGRSRLWSRWQGLT